MGTRQPGSKQHGPHIVRTAEDSGPQSPSKNFLKRSQAENFNLFKATFKCLSPDYKQVDPAQSPGLVCCRERPCSHVLMSQLKKKSRPRNSNFPKVTLK